MATPVLVPARTRWSRLLLRCFDTPGLDTPGLDTPGLATPGEATTGPGDAPRPPTVADLAASLRLDGSPVDEDRVRSLLLDPGDPGRGLREVLPGTPETGGGPGDRRPDHAWVDAMGTLLGEDAPDDAFVARELAGLLDAWSDDRGLATATTPAGLLAALATVHDALTPQLVASQDSGVLRSTAQVVHDAASGRVLHFPPDAASLPRHLDGLLGAWAAGLPGPDGPASTIEAAAVVHQRLALLHPFESANGRLARTVARHLLAAGGVDPTGLDTAMARDTVGHWEQLVADRRRGTAARTVEVFAEHLLAARAARASAGHADHGLHGLLGLPRTFTVADARDALGMDLDTTLARLVEAALTGAIAPVVATSGLRWTRAAP